MTTEDVIDAMLDYAPMRSTIYEAGEDLAASEGIAADALAMLIAYLRNSGILPDRDVVLQAVDMIVRKLVDSQPNIGPLAKQMSQLPPGGGV